MAGLSSGTANVTPESPCVGLSFLLECRTVPPLSVAAMVFDSYYFCYDTSFDFIDHAIHTKQIKAG